MDTNGINCHSRVRQPQDPDFCQNHSKQGPLKIRTGLEYLPKKRSGLLIKLHTRTRPKWQLGFLNLRCLLSRDIFGKSWNARPMRPVLFIVLKVSFFQQIEHLPCGRFGAEKFRGHFLQSFFSFFLTS